MSLCIFLIIMSVQCSLRLSPSLHCILLLCTLSFYCLSLICFRYTHEYRNVILIITIIIPLEISRLEAETILHVSQIVVITHERQDLTFHPLIGAVALSRGMWDCILYLNG